MPFFQDEDPETSWMLIQENDLIAVFSQFPFDAIFKHLLKMDPNIPSKELFNALLCNMFVQVPHMYRYPLLLTFAHHVGHQSHTTKT